MTDQERKERFATARLLIARRRASRVARVARCRYAGEELTGLQRERLGLSHIKRWSWCGHPRRIELGLAEASCPCSGCGPKCRGYTA